MSESLKSVEKQVLVLPQEKEVWQPKASSNEMMMQVDTVRSMAKAAPVKIGRRALFSWLRIFVHNPGDGERVNLRIPIPIPLVGLLLPSQPPMNQALRLRNMMVESDDPAKTLETYLDSLMAVEFIRVQDDDELVIIGLD
ncbi:MAG: hypothetical protein H6652_15615 [Ardenticatenaceae bacterium]|nr:hypothetical protein [Ardenticatenaceae bacterium]MCB8946990.1 hypothetical protein [Ardenticatenaceae bacterium]